MNWSHIFSKLPSTTPPNITITKASFLLLIILVTFLPTGQAQMESATAVYYIAPDGNDNNPGTLTNPWRTIGRAAGEGALKPGDTVYIRTGTYNEYIKPETSGSPGNPITYRNYPGETPVISGSNYRYWRLHIVDESYLRIEGLTFQGYVGGAIQIRAADENVVGIEIISNTFRDQSPKPGSSSKTITVTPFTSGRIVSQVVIQDNQFFNMDTYNAPVVQFDGEVVDSKIIGNTLTGSTNIGINLAGRPAIGQPRNILIKGNDVSGHGLPGKHAAGIYLDGAGSNIIVEENVVHDGLQGIKVDLEPEAAMLTTQHIIVRRNILYNNSQINLKMGAGETCNQPGELKESVAVHNTIFSSIDNITNVYFNCGKNLRWKNNIFGHNGNNGFQYRLLNEEADTATWILDHNYFWNDSGEIDHYRWIRRFFETLSGFQPAINQDIHSFEGYPRFVDSSNYDFHLEEDSTARDKGGPLTQTINAGSGKVIPVEEAWYFSNGFGLQDGDRIRIGNNPTVSVIAVDYNNHQITVNEPIAWQTGSPVNYEYEDIGPDYGAYEHEFVPALSLIGIPGDRTIHLKWTANFELPSNVTWHIEYGPVGNTPFAVISIPDNIQTYHLTDLVNYTLYEITLSAVQDNQRIMAETIQVMPTDIFFYLPIVYR